MKRTGRISDSCLNKEVSKNRTPFSKNVSVVFVKVLLQ